MSAGEDLEKACPDRREKILLLQDGTLGAQDLEEMHSHFASCSACRGAFEELARIEGRIAEIVGRAGGPSPEVQRRLEGRFRSACEDWGAEKARARLRTRRAALAGSLAAAAIVGIAVAFHVLHREGAARIELSAALSSAGVRGQGAERDVVLTVGFAGPSSRVLYYSIASVEEDLTVRLVLPTLRDGLDYGGYRDSLEAGTEEKVTFEVPAPGTAGRPAPVWFLSFGGFEKLPAEKLGEVEARLREEAGRLKASGASPGGAVDQLRGVLGRTFPFTAAVRAPSGAR